MRKVKFSTGGEDKEGYYVGVAGMSPNMTNLCMLLVEDFEGNIYCLRNSEVKFIGKPINTAPVKVIDLKLVRNVIESLDKDDKNTYTLTDVLNLAMEKNIILVDTEGVAK